MMNTSVTNAMENVGMEENKMMDTTVTSAMKDIVLTEEQQNAVNEIIRECLQTI